LKIKRLIIAISYQPLSIVMILIGLGIVVIALIDSPIQLQIILGLIGLGFIILGLVLLKSQQGSRQLQDQMNTLVTKLDEIHQKVNGVHPYDWTGRVRRV
jgi:glucose uptake protein GlcU